MGRRSRLLRVTLAIAIALTGLTFGRTDAPTSAAPLEQASEPRQNPDGSFEQAGTRSIAPSPLKVELLDEPPQISAAELERLEKAQAETRATGGTKTPPGPNATTREGPPVGPETQVGEQPIGLAGAFGEKEDGPRAPNDLVAGTYSLAGGPSRSHVNEPSVGENANSSMFATYNWYAAQSVNAGATWQYINPGQFPAVNGLQFCCDQDTIYAPSRDAFFWNIQYSRNNTTGNVQRIAVVRGQANLAAGNWHTYDFRPEDHCFGTNLDSDWFDFPHLALSNNYLYLASNVFRAGGAFHCSTVLRLPLNELAAGAGFGYDYYAYWYQDTGDFKSITMTQGATDTMYFTYHVNTTTMKVFTWPEANNAPTSGVDVSHVSYGTGAYTCTVTADSRNPCGREDDRHIAGWVGEGVIGWMWDAPQGTDGFGTFPYPYARFIRLNQNTKAVIQEGYIWHSNFAWIMPSVGINGRGHIGGTIFWAGGSERPSCAGFVDDDLVSGLQPLTTFFVQAGTSSGGQDRWGDYLRTRKGGRSPNQWVATCFAYEGTTPTVTPRVVRFGRERDNVAAPPGNDSFPGSALGLGSAAVVTTGATIEHGEPTNTCTPVGRTAWYTHTPGSTAHYRVKTQGSNFDTALGVFTGGSVGGLASVACNDDGGPGTTSRLTFRGTAGIPYRIQAGGWAGGVSVASGTLQVTVERASALADHDYDLRADFGIFRPNGGINYVLQSGGGIASLYGFGQAGDIPVPGDYDGDGRTDFAIYRPSNGLFSSSLSGGGQYGIANFKGNGPTPVVPIPADYNGDGRTDFGLYYPPNSSSGNSAGIFYVLLTGGGVRSLYNFGFTSSRPIPADYDGDGRADFALYFPPGSYSGQTQGIHYAVLAAGGVRSEYNFGNTGDAPIPADYDGDGRADFAIYRASAGLHFVLLSDGSTRRADGFGAPNAVPIPADYDGDGRADIAMYFPPGSFSGQTQGIHYALLAAGGTRSAYNFGESGDIPLPRRP